MNRSLGRSVGTAVPALVASLLPWGVVTGHWLPGPDGRPVLWLVTRTEAQRRALETRSWLPTQVRVLLMRHGVAPEMVPEIRVMLESEQACDALLGSA